MFCIKIRRFFNRNSSNLKLTITFIFFILSTFILTGHFTVNEFLAFTLEKLNIELNFLQEDSNTPQYEQPWKKYYETQKLYLF